MLTLSDMSSLLEISASQILGTTGVILVLVGIHEMNLPSQMSLR